MPYRPGGTKRRGYRGARRGMQEAGDSWQSNTTKTRRSVRLAAEQPGPPIDGFADYDRRRRNFLLEWEVGVLSLDVQARAHVEQATGFALTAIRSVYLLNGGGVTFLPAFAVLFGTDLVARQFVFMAAGALFVCGLLLTFICNLLGYFVLVYQDQAVHWRREQSATRLKATYDRLMGKEPPDPPTSFEQMEENADRHDCLAENLRLVAIGCLLFGLVCFAGGATSLGFSLLPESQDTSNFRSSDLMTPVPVSP